VLKKKYEEIKDLPLYSTKYDISNNVLIGGGGQAKVYTIKSIID
jgi:hypothetical protein